jgi:hypothetical protein
LLSARYHRKKTTLAASIRLRHRVAAEDVILQDAWERPVHAAITAVTPACLPKIRLDTVELPPADHHFVAVRRINGNRGLIGSISQDIVASRIHVRLVTDEHSVRRDHPRRSFYLSRKSRWIVVFFERLKEWRPVYRRQLLS